MNTLHRKHSEHSAMKILYDISEIGVGQNYPARRTGIFRVVEAVARVLAASPECELTFVTESPLSLDGALLYLRQNKALAHIDVPTPVSQSLYVSLRHVFKKLNQMPLLKPLRSVLANAAMAVHKTFQAVTPGIDADLLAGADIFHATSADSPIPEQVKRARHLKRFLTLYDMTPYLFPEFFPMPKGEEHIFKKVVRSVGNEDWVVAISQSAKEDFCSITKHDEQRVFVTPLAASDLFYPCSDAGHIAEVKRKYGIADTPYFLTLSTLEPRKNIDHVIRSFVELMRQEHLKEVSLVLAGGKGWGYEKIFNEIEGSRDWQKRIIVTGYIADEDLAALYSGATGFAYLSFYEGFGLPPLEAMQCGVPVITSNTSSLPEVVGDAGIQLDPKDRAGLCEAMLRLYRDDAYRAAKAEAAVQQAKQFSWKQCADKTIAAYRASLNS